MSVSQGGIDFQSYQALRSLIRDEVAQLVLQLNLVELAVEQGQKVVRGKIDTTGPDVQNGAGFTLVKNGVGDVTITYSGVRLADSICLVTAQAGAGNRIATIRDRTDTTLRVVRADDAGAVADGVIHFLSIGEPS